MIDELKKKIDARDYRVAVVGLGYVGLPLAVEFAREGFPVVGIDIDSEKTHAINAGRSYIPDISDDYLKEAQEKGGLEATADFSRIGEVDAIIICVPTPLSKTRDPDISYIMSALQEIKKYLKRGHVVSLESTTYPGTTDELVRPTLEESGLKAGTDFFLAFSPERIDPGNRIYTVKNTPKVVGGINEESTDIVSYLYSRVLEKVVPVSSCKVAEMSKLLENTFRSINIALANEMAIMCHILGVDVWEVIEAAATKPFGFMKFYPGPGIGGHCIPIDPLYLSWKLRTLNYNARMIEVASEINTSMPRYVVERVADALNEHMKSVKGSRILVLGIAYKKDVNDTRESPAFDVIKLLEIKGASVEYNDPFVPRARINGHFRESVDLTGDRLREADCVIITTDHSVYDYEFIVKNARLVVDTKNATKGLSENLLRGKVVKL